MSLDGGNVLVRPFAFGAVCVLLWAWVLPPALSAVPVQTVTWIVLAVAGSWVIASGVTAGHASVKGILGLSALLAWAIAAALFRTEPDLLAVRGAIVFIGYLVGGLGLFTAIRLFSGRRAAARIIWLGLLTVASLESVLALLSLVAPGLRNALAAVLEFERSDVFLEASYRAYSPAFGGSAGGAVTLAAVAVAAAVWAHRSARALPWGTAALIAAGAMATGRTALVILSSSVVVAAVARGRRQAIGRGAQVGRASSGTSASAARLGTTLLGSAVLLSLTAVAMVRVPPYVSSQITEEVIPFAIESQADGASLLTGSSPTVERLLGEMYFLPTSGVDTAVGTGQFGRNEGHHISTDVGYVRLIFGFGLVGLLLFLLFLGWLVRLGVNNWNSEFGVLLVCFALVMLVVNFKELHWFNIGTAPLIGIGVAVVGSSNCGDRDVGVRYR